MTSSRTGFTLLEVIIALGILAGAMVVLVDTQAMAVLSTFEADRLMVSTNLAQEKMAEVQIILEREGFGETDIEEDGDFDDFGEEDFRGDELHLSQDRDALKDYKWAYTVRKIELDFPTNLGDMAGDMAGNGYFGEDKGSEMDVGGTPDLGDMGISPSMVSEHLAGFIREVRVRVWWGENEDETDQVELTTHIINPTGVVNEGGFSGLGAGGAAAGGAQ
jgi:prepilin-type N-terminal cleavage/methylation domain-containing protein